MTQDIPRNLIAGIDSADSRPTRDDAALEAEWLSKNVPSERLELHWRYASSSIQLFERHLRSLPLYGVGPALCSYLRTRLEWFSDNKLCQQPTGILVVSVESNGDVDVELNELPSAYSPTLDDLVWDNGRLLGADRKGALFVRSGSVVSVYGGFPLRDACETFAFDLVKTLAHSFGYEVDENFSLAKSDLSDAEIFFVSDEDGLAVFDGHGGELSEKLTSCFDKLWSTTSRA